MFQPGNFGPVILLTLNAAATEPFGDYTDGHIGAYINLVLDKRVISSAIIESRINGVAALEGPDADALQTVIYEDTEQFLLRPENRVKIEALADALLEHRQLLYEAAWKVIENA